MFGFDDALIAGVGGSLLSGFMGSNSAEDAAKAKAEAAAKAGELYIGATADNATAIRDATTKGNARLDPLAEQGTTARARYGNLSGLNGAEAEQQAVNDVENSATYKAALGANNAASTARMNNAGLAYSGAGAADLAKVGIDTLNGAVQQRLGNWKPVMQSGDNALFQQSGNDVGQGKQLVDNTKWGTTGSANALLGIGNAQAEGATNSGNAWQSALGSMMKPMGASGGGGGSMLSTAIGSIFSDERVKHDVEEADPENALLSLRKVKPVSYEYDEGYGPEGKRRGFTAQDMEKSGAARVGEDQNGVKKVDVQSLLETLVHSVQALDQKLSAMKGA